jgi:hypothetical protein
MFPTNCFWDASAVPSDGVLGAVLPKTYLEREGHRRRHSTSIPRAVATGPKDSTLARETHDSRATPHQYRKR